MIVGAGGHGLATAYYLGRNHGIRNVAVLEKGWLGGGNTGRNTTIIRSNYLQDASAAIYEKARSLYETLSQELNFNVMFSPRGVMMLAQTEHEVKGYRRTAMANALQGVATEFIGPDRVKALVPIIRIDGPRYPVLGALWQPRGGTARQFVVFMVLSPATGVRSRNYHTPPTHRPAVCRQFQNSANRAQSGMPDTQGMGWKEIGGIILLLVILLIAYSLYQMFFG